MPKMSRSRELRKFTPNPESQTLNPTQRPQCSSFWGLPYRILNMNPQKELLWGLWVNPNPEPQTLKPKRSKPFINPEP